MGGSAKVLGGTGGNVGLNVKNVHFSKAQAGNFPFFPDTLGKIILHLS